VKNLPLPIDVKPYVLNGVLGGDNYLTHYKASNDDGESFIITEFYPAYMVKREDDGTLGISERFTKEYTQDREEFIRRAEGFREAGNASLHPVVEIFERNHTAYIVRRTCGLTSLDQFMGSATMDFDEAYFFLRSLITGMAVVSERGMLFNINYADFRVNSYKQVVLCSPPSWDNDFHKPLIQLARVYYRLVTGAEAPEQGAPAFSAYGIDIPPRIESFIMEILGGDILYGSLDDFHKKFKSLIEGTMESANDAGKRTLAAMRGTIAVLFVIFVLSLTVLVYGAVRAHIETTFWANPENFADSSSPPPPLYDFSNIVLTHPRNSADPLNGSFAAFDGFIFFRGEGGMYSRLFGDIAFIPGAVGMTALANDRRIVPDAIPSFMVGHDRELYFVDAASDGAIFRVSTTGNNITRITEGAALNLAVVNDYLFYTSVADNHSLWRYDIKNNRLDKLGETPIHAITSSGSHLFFIEKDSNGATLYSWDLDKASRLEIATDAAGGLRVFNETLFYINNNGQVQSVTFDGRKIETHSPQNVRSYDVFFQWLVFTEEGVHVPRAYNMDSNEFFTLSATEWASYIWVNDGRIYGIDHRNPQLVRNFNFP